MNVNFIEPVGGHRGMQFYDVELCQALQLTGLNVLWLTCDETRLMDIPATLKVDYSFRGIYGDSPKLLRGLRYMRALRSISFGSSQRAADLFHFHFFIFPPFDLLNISRLCKANKSIVVTAHDVVPFDARRSDLAWLRHIYHKADQIIVHAKSNREAMIQTFGVRADKVHVIPMGPYPHLTQNHTHSVGSARQHIGLDVNKPVVLFFGQIKRVKGLQHLIRAFRIVVDEYPDAQLFIAGPEWKEPFAPYAALIDELGLAGRVHTRIEYVAGKDVAWYYSAADIVVLPYTEIFQSSVLYMAYSFEKPVIASAVGGLTEVVRDGVTGLLVPPADPPLLANALLQLLRQPKLAQQMGQQGKLLVETEFSWPVIARKTAEVYANAIAAKSKHS